MDNRTTNSARFNTFRNHNTDLRKRAEMIHQNLSVILYLTRCTILSLITIKNTDDPNDQYFTEVQERVEIF